MRGQPEALRRRGARRSRTIELPPGPPAARALAVPTDPDGRRAVRGDLRPVLLDLPRRLLRLGAGPRLPRPEGGEEATPGGCSSAGFHSMTGYFRDDGPLYELILDEPGSSELDALWQEFDFITGAPMRQYTSFLWFERTESRFMRDPEFDFARAEDKDATSEAKIEQLAEVYLAKAQRHRGERRRRSRRSRDHFTDHLGEHPPGRAGPRGGRAEPPRGARRRSPSGPTAGRCRRPSATSSPRSTASLREQDGLSHEDAVRDTRRQRPDVAPLLLPRRPRRRAGRGVAAAVGLRPGQPAELLPLVEHARRRAARPAPPRATCTSPRCSSPRPGGCSATTAVRGLATEFARQLARLPPVRGAQQRRPRAVPDASRTSCGRRCSRSRSASSSTSSATTARCSTSSTAEHTFVNPVLARHYGMPDADGGPDDWVRVDDADQYGRGGLLPMAVFLTKNSPGLRTSPVKRGYWVVRRLLGEHIPPPPPTVPELPERRGEARRPDAPRDAGPAPRRHELRRLPRAVRLDRPGLRGLRPGRRAARRRTSAAGRSTRAATFPGGGEGDRARRAARLPRASTGRTSSSTTSAASCWPTPWAGACSPSDDATIDAMQAAAGGRRLPLRRPGRERSSPARSS